jgi:hypothetical protein
MRVAEKIELDAAVKAPIAHDLPGLNFVSHAAHQSLPARRSLERHERPLRPWSSSP